MLSEVVFQECGHTDTTSTSLFLRLGWFIMNGKVHPGWCQRCQYARIDTYAYRDQHRHPQRDDARREHPVFEVLQLDGSISVFPANHINSQEKRKALWHCWRCMKARQYRGPDNRGDTAGLCCYNRNARLEWDLWEACPEDDHSESRAPSWPPKPSSILPRVVGACSPPTPIPIPSPRAISTAVPTPIGLGLRHVNVAHSHPGQNPGPPPWDHDEDTEDRGSDVAEPLLRYDEILLTREFLEEQAQLDAADAQAPRNRHVHFEPEAAGRPGPAPGPAPRRAIRPTVSWDPSPAPRPGTSPAVRPAPPPTARPAPRPAPDSVDTRLPNERQTVLLPRSTSADSSDSQRPSARSKSRTAPARSSSPPPIVEYTDDESYALEGAVAADESLEARPQPARRRRWQDDGGYYNSPEYANVLRLTRHIGQDRR
ncbi:hypothetical protein BJ875DRAFT_443940 [Amylocarpus encephaloides]|uniref:Uncharacterized protein n=1 Tax=Amylocarpus encephaloides TaxID=45428 RepID=A0A9P8C2K0_9HELO|nr:hypothetical protein BJ875DRAFT_443940 [Amylocarpus encephaloides]